MPEILKDSSNRVDATGTSVCFISLCPVLAIADVERTDKPRRPYSSLCVLDVFPIFFQSHITELFLVRPTFLHNKPGLPSFVVFQALITLTVFYQLYGTVSNIVGCYFI